MIKGNSQKNFFIFFLVFFTLIFFISKPVFLEGKVLINSNLLVSFFNPWAHEKFIGWESGIPNKPIGIDDLRIFYPQRSFTTEMLKKAEFPFWNPYNYSGNAHLALSETAVFYPLSLIFFLLPQLTSWSILILIQPIIASLGMYLYLRLILKDNKSSLFGALVFGFSGVVLVRMVEGLSVGHALIWLPFAFYGIEGFLQNNKIRYLIILLLALTFSLLSGWFQFTFYIYVFSLLYAFLRVFSINNQKIIKNKFLVFTPFVLLPLITLYQIIPAIQMYYSSPRGINTYNILRLHLMPLQHLLTFIFPDFWGNPGAYNFFGKSEYKESIVYIGLVPFFLSFISILKLKSRKIIQFFFISVLSTLLLALNNPISDFLIKIPFPIISSFLPNRIFLISTFAFSILSAFGVKFLLINYPENKKELIKLPLIIIGISILAVDIYVLSLIFINYLMQNNFGIPELNRLSNFFWTVGLTTKEWQLLVQLKNIIIPNVLFLTLLIIFTILRKKISKNILFSLLLILTITGQVYFAKKYLAFSERYFTFPHNEVFSYLKKNSGINRFISTGEGYIPSNFSLFFRLYSPEGISSMYINRYGELVKYVQSQGESIENVPRIEARIESSSKSLFDNKNKYLIRFMQIDGIKYIVKLKNETDKNTGVVTMGNDFLKLVWQNDKWQIFEYRNFMPRVFWTSKYEVVKSDEMLPKLFDENFDSRALLLEKEINLKTDPRIKGDVKILKYEPNEIILQVYSDGNGLIYISDNYSPQFRVRIDDKNGNILRANYSFRAIPVEKGNHRVTIFYDSKEMQYEIIIGMTVVAIVLLGTLVLVKKKIIEI